MNNISIALQLYASSKHFASNKCYKCLMVEGLYDKSILSYGLQLWATVILPLTKMFSNVSVIVQIWTRGQANILCRMRGT